MLTADNRKQIIDNNKKISGLLAQNEQILRDAGYMPPITNISLRPKEKIVFPPGYIRTVAVFIKRYHLYQLFPDWKKRNNIAYALEVSDLLNS